ncbi:MAG: GDP-L-fucose synthase [Chlamydiae bacterium]|nr:GDP-L-fucose synthase [Chlamydiota bacterium]MBI3277328.1 GDP-L-fucose synthase [Chlamydiota bacterium]
MSDFWKNQSVVVTGGGGFLGTHVVNRFIQEGCKDVYSVKSSEYDLRDGGDIVHLFRKTQPDCLIHLAAVVGGIGANMKHPGKFFYDNAMMGIQLIEQARIFKIKKIVLLGTVCAYPKFTPVPFREENLWNGYPEETNAPYGLAKKMLLVQSQAYRQEYGLNSIYLLPVNLYGPGDNFDSESSHVIPALVKKCLEAISEERDEIGVWGTGSASREFLYVEDAAEGIVLAAEKYNKAGPINLGSGMEITIKDLIFLIAELTGFKGKIVWDHTKPNGQPRRSLEISQAENEFSFKAKTPFREGLKRTIEWYRSKMVNESIAKP